VATLLNYPKLKPAKPRPAGLRLSRLGNLELRRSRRDGKRNVEQDTEKT